MSLPVLRPGSHMAATKEVTMPGAKAAAAGRSDELSVRTSTLALAPGSDTYPRLNVIVFGVLYPKNALPGKPVKGY